MTTEKQIQTYNELNAGKAPKNESVEDSFLDGINYFKMAYCCHLDKKLEIYPEEEIHF